MSIVKKNIKIMGKIKIMIPAGKATPAAPLGPALGQKQINIMEFCKLFNDRTKKIESNTLVRTIIVSYINKTFDFEVKGEPTANIIKKYLKIEKGSSAPGREKILQITSQQLTELVELQKKNGISNTNNLNKLKNTITSCLKSMGISIGE